MRQCRLGMQIWSNQDAVVSSRCCLRSSTNPISMPEPDLFICLLTIELMIPSARSLKDKRSSVRSLKDRLRSRFNASVAEVAYHDKWQRAVIAACILGNDKRRIEADMTRVRQLCEEAQEIQIADMHQQWL